MTLISDIFNSAHYSYSPYALPGIFVGGFIILLGLAVMIREKFSDVSVAFSFLTTSTAISLLSLGASYLTIPEFLAYRWVQIAHLGVVFIPSTVYLFALAVVRRIPQFKNTSSIFYLSDLSKTSAMRRSISPSREAAAFRLMA